MLMVLVRGGFLWRLPRIQRWVGSWKRQDPPFDHWHLGPAAVDRARQGQGIGTSLMAEVCKRQGVGYLETDKAANVRSYRRGGFEVVAERSVLGVDNWFMVRCPGACEVLIDAEPQSSWGRSPGNAVIPGPSPFELAMTPE